MTIWADSNLSEFEKKTISKELAKIEQSPTYVLRVQNKLAATNVQAFITSFIDARNRLENGSRTSCWNNHVWTRSTTLWRWRNRSSNGSKFYMGWERDCLVCKSERKKGNVTK